MTAYNALLTYEKILREFQNHINEKGYNSLSAIEAGFEYLTVRLHLDVLSLFWYDKKKNALLMKYIYQDGTLMEGEEEISLVPPSPLEKMAKERIPVVVSDRHPWVAYIFLGDDGQFIGAVRIERKRRLPAGRVLGALPSRYTQQILSKRTPNPFLTDLGDIISGRLHWLKREETHKTKAQYLLAGTEVATAVVETPRLNDMLEAVSRSIVKNLGFDRIRFYLLDSGRTEIRGVMGLQMPDRLLDISGEHYPIQPGLNSLVEAILTGNGPGGRLTSAGRRVVYIPLVVGGQVIGCIAVDNLLSQIAIDDDQILTLRSLAGQIGMAVLNARLFEDIEQQAITDGLTKLYVYRYFQQRLKEEIDRAERYSYGVALVMMDVDNFKLFNDSYGHSIGDRVLEFLAQTIRANIRRIDLAARYGGDEFILLLPEITEQEAWMMGTRLLSALKESAVKTNTGEKINVQVTLGISMYPTDAKSGRDLMEAADKALYWAKRHARGDICFFRNVANNVEKTV